MRINSNNEPTNIFDKHFAIKCPSCNIKSNTTAISIPRYEFLIRFRPTNVGITYRCDNCNEPVFLKFKVAKYDTQNARIVIDEDFEQIERAKENFDLQYLPEEVSENFKEALDCFSISCWNAFASMSRRTIQCVSEDLGAEGSTKVQNQIINLKDMGIVDDEVFKQLKQIILTGHDGAHPHLPKINAERANILLELMKDVLYQLYIRAAKIKEAAQLRATATQNDSEKESQ